MTSIWPGCATQLRRRRRHQLLRTTCLSATKVAQPTVHRSPRLDTIRPDGPGPNAQRLRLEVLAQREILRSLRAFPRRAIANHGGRTAADEHVLLLVAHHRLG